MSNFTKLDMDLQFAIDHGKNVILVGEKGVGKTQIIKKYFQKKFKKWKYYSTPTMDPWVDLVGCPKEKVDPKTGIAYLELIRPKEWANDEIEAIFLDECNRAPNKVKNALMELLLFKSINGQVFKNLKVIWAAINPDDGTYQTEELDPAQIDRFSYKINIPYDVNNEYFEDKYGADMAAAACDWWRNLDDAKKKLVSPRRLDEALDIINLGGHIDNVLDQQTNPGKLLKEIKSGSVINVLMNILKKGRDEGQLTTFFNSDNNYFSCKDYILKKDNSLLQFISEERLAELISNNKEIREYCLQNIGQQPKFNDTVEQIIKANSNKELVNEINNNIHYFTYQIEKNTNNEELKAAEADLLQVIRDQGLDYVEKNANLSDEPEIYKKQQVDGGNLAGEKVVWDYIEKNKSKLTSSDFTLNVICKGIVNYAKKFSNSDEIKDYILHTNI